MEQVSTRLADIAKPRKNIFARMADETIPAMKVFFQRGVNRLIARFDKVDQRLSADEKRIEALHQKMAMKHDR